MVFNATFNNISVLSWQSVLLVEKTEDVTTDLWQVTDKIYHIMLSRVHVDRHWLHRQHKYTPLRYNLILILGDQRYFQQYFSYIMATSFSGGRSRSTRKEPPAMGKQMVNFITCGCATTIYKQPKPSEKINVRF